MLLERSWAPAAAASRHHPHSSTAVVCVCSTAYSEFLQEQTKVMARLFGREQFDPKKLTVSFQTSQQRFCCSSSSSVAELLPRRYTLTHNDATANLLLSVGACFNQEQLQNWYTLLMRDGIVAEWKSEGRLSLHVHCHVSGGHRLLAPAALRYQIFQCEMPLVLQAIRYGDSELFSQHPACDNSHVWVHYSSDDPEFNRADCWGPLLGAANGFTIFHRQASIQPKFFTMFA